MIANPNPKLNTIRNEKERKRKVSKERGKAV